MIGPATVQSNISSFQVVDPQSPRLGDAQTFGTSQFAPILLPADLSFGEMPHGTLDNDGGLGKKVGSSSDGKTEPFFLSGLDVDAFQANDLRATLSGVNMLCGKTNGRSLGSSNNR